MKLFENPFLESITKGHPIIPYLFWGLSFFLYQFMSQPKWIYSLVLLGLFLWSFLEYIMHRWLFHIKSPNQTIQKFQFILHGNHHEKPRDYYRAVMPIVPAFFYALMVYLLLDLTIQNRSAKDSLFLGLILGYLLYDALHLSFHHMQLPFKWWKNLRRSHALHHHEGDILFGVSSPLWDIIFKTIKKNKANKTHG